MFISKLEHVIIDCYIDRYRHIDPHLNGISVICRLGLVIVPTIKKFGLCIFGQFKKIKVYIIILLLVL